MYLWIPKINYDDTADNDHGFTFTTFLSMQDRKIMFSTVGGHFSEVFLEFSNVFFKLNFFFQIVLLETRNWICHSQHKK